MSIYVFYFEVLRSPVYTFRNSSISLPQETPTFAVFKLEKILLILVNRYLQLMLVSVDKIYKSINQYY